MFSARLSAAFLAQHGSRGLHLDRRHPLGAARELQRKRAAVAEAVEAPAARVRPGAQPVFALVEEGARLLAGEHVEPHDCLALAVDERPRLLPADDALHLCQPLELPDPDVVPLDEGAQAEGAPEQLREQLLPLLGGRDERLHDGHVAEAVDDEPGQEVGLAMDDPYRGLPREDLLSQRQRRGEALREELLVDGTSSRETVRRTILERADQNALPRNRPRPSFMTTTSPPTRLAGDRSTSPR